VRNACKVFKGKLERNRLLGKPECGWKDAIMIDFKEIISKGFGQGLFALGYRAMMNRCVHSNEPVGTITNFKELSESLRSQQLRGH
jgi:hypothetical protein